MAKVLVKSLVFRALSADTRPVDYTVFTVNPQ